MSWNWISRLARSLKDATLPIDSQQRMTMEAKRKSIDIGRQRIGTIYGTALLRACGAKAHDVLAELQSIVEDVFERSPKLELVLSSPRVNATEKLALLDKVFGSRISSELLRFLKVVAQHDRLDCLSEIYREAHRLRNEQFGVLQMDMVTAQAIDDAMAKRIAQALKQKFNADIELRTLIDPKLIGGFLIRTQDKVYDASIARKLELMRADALRETVHQLRQRSEQFAME